MPDFVALFTSVRKHSVYLCEPLETEDYVPQPVVYVSPAKWHLAHTTWFFEEFILKQFKSNYRVFNAKYSFLFNSYYNTVGDKLIRTDRGNLTRPSVAEIYNYRNYVDEKMCELLAYDEMPDQVGELLTLGLNHEQQHQELLLTDMKYILGHNPLFPVYKEGFSLVQTKNEDIGLLSIESGLYDIGFAGEGFCYDNELGRHKVFLEALEIQRELVTNDEFIDFINDDGYKRFDLWLDEGWQWVNQNNVNCPLYWHKIDDKWHNYTLSGLLPVEDEDILAHISYYEAQAYAQWRGMRLPTEFEWEVAADQLKWGQRWEWTSSAYAPYPNFKIAEGAIGEYNGKFMVNQMVLRGASASTSVGHSRKTYRNFFHPQYQWQLTGIRLAKS